MELYTNFTWLYMHLWLNLINWTIDIQEKKKIVILLLLLLQISHNIDGFRQNNSRGF